MSRVHFRGGPWTNAEDQVLKAGLAQYGLRDWERVASMLTKKTAAQCRERWENYLDPRLHLKEAWSPEEEEKLVELQSLFPNQWRLISQQLTKSTPAKYIRPAWLCEQHYLEVRDAHEFEVKQQQQRQKKAKKAEKGDKADDADEDEEEEEIPETLEEYLKQRRHRRVAYQAHEEKAARADTVDGDPFQQEMLTMAVSRLANQDQKKGLRKERERKLEEASFLAKLESNRESIESGTLSARQEKRMRRALEEDRRGRLPAPQRRRIEGGDGDDDDSAFGDYSDAEGEEEAFEPTDVLEDQERAGIEKKSRKLLVDLGGQQESITTRTTEGSRAAAGVNLSLLDSLAAAAPAAPAIEGGVPAVGLLTEKSAAAAASRPTTWESLAGPSPAAASIDDIFASLPDVVGAPGAKAAKTSKASAAVAAAAATTTTTTTTMPARSVSAVGSYAALSAEDAAPRGEAPLALPSSSLSPHEAAGGRLGPSSIAALFVPPPPFPGADPSPSAERAPPLRDVDAAGLATAKALIAVEMERCVVAEHRRRQRQQQRRQQAATVSITPEEDESEDRSPSATPLLADGAASDAASQRPDSDGTPPPPGIAVTDADVAYVKERLRVLVPPPAEPDQQLEGDEEARVRPDPLVLAVAKAQGEAQYHTDINAGLLARALEAAVREDVGKVNRRLAAMEQRVSGIAATCYLDAAHDTFLAPFVDPASGTLRVGCGSGSTSDHGAVRHAGLLLSYVKQRWEGACRTSERNALFLTQLREREQQDMARRLDDAKFTLDALLAREAEVQQMYRERGSKP